MRFLDWRRDCSAPELARHSRAHRPLGRARFEHRGGLALAVPCLLSPPLGVARDLRRVSSPRLGAAAVRVICAWCQREGRSGFLRVREPLEDTSDTHGICERHQQLVFEAFPSKSFPSIRWLFIVARGDVARYEHQARILRDIPGVAVIMDRRHADRRRRSTGPVTPERRRVDRRVRTIEMNSLGYALVRFAAREFPASGASAPDDDPPDATGAAGAE